ncbi:MAG: exonuclease SbcCD subunit D [Oscillospiraceae bacterium]|nr:exonuclease SbcCD subunit D [Oscillospiraceae bacterium]
MKFLHLSDLHLGKRLNEFSLIEDQEYILSEIIKIAEDERPDGVFIAGDVYDKTVPSAEAVQLFDKFLCALSELKIKVFIISGNHDSSERIAFGGRLMQSSGIYVAPVYGGKTEAVAMGDGVNIFMLPFIKPASVRRFFPDIESYTDALSSAIGQMKIKKEEFNILITHQFVTGAVTSDSEEISVGGTDNVSASVFAPFDYVALGHIHSPQNIESERIRYSGTPLKYSFSEAKQEKSVTVLEIKGKNFDIRTIPLNPLRDLREIKGTYLEITDRKNYINTNTNTNDYLHIILTDEEDIPEALGKLRIIYPNLMKLSYDNKRTRSGSFVGTAEKVEEKTPIELFMELYEKQNGEPMNTEQIEFVKSLMDEEADL